MGILQAWHLNPRVNHFDSAVEGRRTLAQTEWSQKSALVHVVKQSRVDKFSGYRYSKDAFMVLFFSFYPSPGSASSVLTPFTDWLSLRGYKMICSYSQDPILPGSIIAPKNDSPWASIPGQVLRVTLRERLTSKLGKWDALIGLWPDCIACFLPGWRLELHPDHMTGEWRKDESLNQIYFEKMRKRMMDG